MFLKATALNVAWIAEFVERSVLKAALARLPAPLQLPRLSDLQVLHMSVRDWWNGGHDKGPAHESAPDSRPKDSPHVDVSAERIIAEHNSTVSAVEAPQPMQTMTADDQRASAAGEAPPGSDLFDSRTDAAAATGAEEVGSKDVAGLGSDRAGSDGSGPSGITKRGQGRRQRWGLPGGFGAAAWNRARGAARIASSPVLSAAHFASFPVRCEPRLQYNGSP